VSDAAVETARFAWEGGVARLAEPPAPAVARARARLVDAVHEELRRRVGATFTLRELAAAYADASGWYLDLAARTAPRQPEAWEPAVTLDGAFGLYARQATDARA
jgi:cytochrome c551/c552